MRYMVLTGLVLLGASLSGHREDSPSKAVSRAVHLRKDCPYTLTKVAYDKQGVELPPGAKSHVSEVMRLVTLPFLFRDGRFAYSWGPEGRLATGPAFTVLFFPRPSRQQLKPLEGENKYFTLGVNHLRGKVLIDRATRQIILIDAEVNPAVPIKKMFFKVGLIEIFSVKFYQVPKNGGWQPVEAEIKAKYGATNGVFAHEEYTARFACR